MKGLNGSIPQTMGDVDVQNVYYGLQRLIVQGDKFMKNMAIVRLIDANELGMRTVGSSFSNSAFN